MGAEQEAAVARELDALYREAKAHFHNRDVAAVGLQPPAGQLARMEPTPPPTDPERFEREYEAWLGQVGWRT